MVLLGIALAYIGLLGILQIVSFNEWTGGRIGRFLAGTLQPLLTTPGAFVLMLGLLVAGLLIAFDMPVGTASVLDSRLVSLFKVLAAWVDSSSKTVMMSPTR